MPKTSKPAQPDTAATAAAPAALTPSTAVTTAAHPAAPKPHPKVHISAKDRDYLTTNLALLLSAAVPVGEALNSLAETAVSKTFKYALQVMRRDIDDGTPLWKALEQSGMVGPQTLALVRLGEESGNMVKNLQVAARQEEKQRMFRSKVRSALLYPTFVLGLTAVVGLAISWFLLPRLSVTFAQLNVALPPITKVFIGIGNFLKRDGVWAVPAIFGVVITGLYILFGARPTRHIGNSLLFHIPGVSKMMYEVEVSRFGYLLGTLLDAGLSVTQALDLLQQATTSRRYQEFYRHLHDAFEDGYGFRNSLPMYKPAAKLLPPAVRQMVIASERSGSLPNTLQEVGKIYEEKADISTGNLETTLEPILLVIVWLGVMGVAVAVILPVYKLVGNLGA